MKNLCLLIFTCLLCFSCKEAEPKLPHYTITGTAKGVYNGVRIHLKSSDDKEKDKIVSTRMVKNESFFIEGRVDMPTLYNISIDGIQGKLPIMVENSNINIDINKSKIEESKITGSKAQEDYDRFYIGFNKLDKEIFATVKEFRKYRSQNNKTKLDSLSNQMKIIDNKKTQYVIDFINNNEDNFFSLFLISKQLNNKKLDAKKYMDAFNNLSSEIKSSKKGIEIKLKLENLLDNYLKTNQPKIEK